MLNRTSCDKSRHKIEREGPWWPQHRLCTLLYFTYWLHKQGYNQSIRPITTSQSVLSLSQIGCRLFGGKRKHTEEQCGITWRAETLASHHFHWQEHKLKSWHGSFKKEGGMKTFVEKRSALSAFTSWHYDFCCLFMPLFFCNPAKCDTGLTVWDFEQKCKILKILIFYFKCLKLRNFIFTSLF